MGGVVSKRRQFMLLLFGALAIAGVYDAVHNLPVLTGCSFYGSCGDEGPARTEVVATAER